MNTAATFYAFAAGASWLLASLLFIIWERVSRRANRWLAAFYAILACSFVQLFLEGMAIRANLSVHLMELPRWAMLPCLYMAVAHYVSPAAAPKAWFLHFAPFLLFLLFSLSVIMPSMAEDGSCLPQLPTWLSFTLRYFFFGQMLCYWLLCFFLLRRHRRNLQQLASFTDRIDLRWLHYMLLALLLLIFVRLLSIVNMQIYQYSPILYFLGVLLLAHATLQQRSIYSTEPYRPVEGDGLSEKTKNERLTADQVEALRSIVVQKTSQQKLYLDPGLTLSALSDKIGISTHELSYVLNNGLGQTFYQFINALRTEEAKVLLLSADTAHLDMLGIAIRAGFNSKTTFYTTFKKATNLTPKAYIQANKRDN